MAASVERNTRLIIQLAREHAKSTWFSFIRVLRRICQNRNIRIVIISKTKTTASKFVVQVQQQLEFNERIIADFGQFKGPGVKWADDEFVVLRTAKFRDPTLQAVGRGGQIVSGRYELVILDDCEDYESTRTPERRLSTYQWLLNDVTPVVTAQGQLIIIQTPQHEGDLANQVARELKWRLVNVPAEYTVPDPDAPPEVPETKRRQVRVSTWGAKWPVYWTNCEIKRLEETRGLDVNADDSKLRAVARVGDGTGVCERCPVYDPTAGDTQGRGCLTGKRFETSLIYYRLQYLVDLAALSGQIFRPGWFHRYAPTDVHWSAERGWQYLDETLKIVIGIDPAVADETDKADAEHSEFALVVLGWAPLRRRRVVLHYEHGRYDWPTQVRMSVEQYRAWRPSLVMVEKVQYQRVLAQELREHGVPAYPWQSDEDKFRRFVAKTTVFESHIPDMADGTPGRGGVYIRPEHQAFQKQFTDFPNGLLTDLMDAFVLADAGLLGGAMFEDVAREALEAVQRGRREAGLLHPVPAPAPGEWTWQQMISGWRG